MPIIAELQPQSHPLSYNHIQLGVLHFFQRYVCSASTATSSIILLRDDKYIVKGNNHNKQEGAFPKREKSKFSSATSLILVILVCRTCLYNGPHLIFKPCIQSNIKK